MSADGAAVSPRTAQFPMAFTRAEFLRGAIAAWVWFLVLATVLYAVTLQALVVVAALFFLPWSVAGLVVGSPLAYLLGRLLRRVRAVVVHLVAFAALGGVVAAATTAVFLLSRGDGAGGALYYLVNIVASVAAVALGWHWTVRRALQPPRPARIDVDAAAEDAALRRAASDNPR